MSSSAIVLVLTSVVVTRSTPSEPREVTTTSSGWPAGAVATMSAAWSSRPDDAAVGADSDTTVAATRGRTAMRRRARKLVLVTDGPLGDGAQDTNSQELITPSTKQRSGSNDEDV